MCSPPPSCKVVPAGPRALRSSSLLLGGTRPSEGWGTPEAGRGEGLYPCPSVCQDL